MNPLRILALAAMLLGSTAVAYGQDDAAAAALANGDPVKGEVVFKKCMTCHRVGEGAKIAVGPVLNGVIGRQAGTFEGYKYSNLNQTAGENGLVWNETRIFEYLPDPQAFLVGFLKDQGKGDLVKGRTKMPFKLQKEQDRADVIAYLKQFSPAPTQ
jgi:cytochrome c